jgi:hypothetical protein
MSAASSGRLVSVAFAGALTQGCIPTDCMETETCLEVAGDNALSNDSSTGRNEANSGADVGVASDSAAEFAPRQTDDAADAGDAAPIRPDADGGRFCASQPSRPTFCDDFDERPLPGPWSSFTATGGSLKLDPSAFVTPPNSLLAQDAPLPFGQPLDTALQTQFALPTSPATIVLAFQMQPVQADPNAGAATVVAALDFTDVANNRYTVQFALVQQGMGLSLRLEEQAGFFDGGGAYMSHPVPDPLNVGTWTPIGLTLNWTAPSSVRALVTFATAPEIEVPLAMSVNATSLQLTIGSTFENEPSQGWKNRYDNVVLDIR